MYLEVTFPLNPQMNPQENEVIKTNARRIYANLVQMLRISADSE